MVSDRQITRQTEKRIVTITEVNVRERKIVAHDEYGGTLPIAMHLRGDVVVVPAPGERWVVQRSGNQFYLDMRVIDGVDDDMAPGDVKVAASNDVLIEGDNDVVIQGDDVLINGRSADDFLTLSQLPATPSVVTEVAKDGTLVGTRKRINLITGANTTLTVTDNSAQNRVDITIAGTTPWTDTGWQRLGIEIPYLGGHSDYGAEWGQPGAVALRRLPSGLVVGRGLIQSGSGPVFTIPAGMRPSSEPWGWIMMTANSSGSNESFRMYTDAGVANGHGTDQPAWTMRNSPGWAWASLEGISWYAEQ